MRVGMGARKVDRLTVQLTMWVILRPSSMFRVLATSLFPTKIVPLPSPLLHSDRASARERVRAHEQGGRGGGKTRL